MVRHLGGYDTPPSVHRRMRDERIDLRVATKREVAQSGLKRVQIGLHVRYLKGH